MSKRITSDNLRSRHWFRDMSDPGATALHVERYTNFGLSAATRERSLRWMMRWMMR